MQTPNGKEIEIVRDPRTAAFKVQFTSGGELPPELTGFFTRATTAEAAINSYLDRIKDRKPVDAKGNNRKAD